MPGVEKIAWLEIRDRLAPVTFLDFLYAKELNGIVLFEYGGPLAELLQLRTAEDVFLLALSEERLSRGYRDLRHLPELIATSESFGLAANTLVRWRRLGANPSYRIVSRQIGQHEYRRKDFQAAVIQGVEQRYRGRWRPVAEDADIEIWANLVGSRLLIGLRLSDRTMRHRFERPLELPASLRPSVAAAMVLLTEPEPGDIFLDPFCGSGTLLLERSAAGRYGLLLGGDIVYRSAAVTRDSPTLQRRGRLIGQWDAGRLPLASESVSKVATNLPFGKQILTPRGVQALYPAFFAELARVLHPGGRAVVLSSEFDLVKETLRHQPTLSILTGYSIAVLGQWGRIYILQRQAG
jgi:23S rRNA G2445 N2-methylase RlmL